MYSLKSILVASFLVLTASASAIAAELAATVTPDQPSVSLSFGSSQPVASYTVTLTNVNASGSINNARFVGETTVVGAAGVSAEFKTATGYACTVTNGAKTAIDCFVGALAAGQTSAPLTLTFTAPTAGTGLELAWQAIFDLGTPPGNSNGESGTSSVVLSALDDSSVTSVVPKDLAVSFFTGTGIATAVDPWVTKVKVPAGALATTAVVEEEVSLITCAPDLLTCSTSTVTIPSATFGSAGTRPLSQFLEITLLRDQSTIAKGAKIGSAVVYYKKEGDPNYVVVQSCADLTLPMAGTPCEDLTQRFAYPKKSTGKAPVPAGFEGDWRFVFYASDNGKYSQ
jgi:hypothetical protein